MKRAAKCQF